VQVVAVTPLYPPSSRVGAWLATHECLRHLAERGHSVTVVRYMQAGGRSYELEGVKVHGGHPFESVIKQADVVVSHLGDDGRAERVAKQYGKPLVRMVHGWTSDAEAKLAGADLAVFNSEASRSEFPFTGASIVVHPVTRPELHRTTPGERVTLVNLTPSKGGEVFRFLAASLHDVPFLGVVGGWGRQENRRLGSNVEVVKSTPNMRDDVWAKTHILLMPSERETWGMAGIEAMCSGIPVIAHPTAGLRESLGDAGIFVDRDDFGGWCDEIRRLLEPDEWLTASKAALARVDELDFRSGLDLFADSVEALCVS
jgi:glycosyltransferase involved in cell wall biosynthesis